MQNTSNKNSSKGSYKYVNNNNHNDNNNNNIYYTNANTTINSNVLTVLIHPPSRPPLSTSSRVCPRCLSSCACATSYAV